MKTKLLSILLVLSLMLSFTACKNVSEADTTDAETEDTEYIETYGNLIRHRHPPEWYVNANAFYAIVKITEITSVTKELGNSNPAAAYQKFMYIRVYSNHTGFSETGEIYIAENSEEKIMSGDILFFQLELYEEIDATYWLAAINNSLQSDYKIFTDGKINLTDNDLSKHSFFAIYTYNMGISSANKASQSKYDMTPSYPTKELCGEVTVDEISDFLDSIKKAYGEYQQFLEDIWATTKLRGYYY